MFLYSRGQLPVRAAGAPGEHGGPRHRGRERQAHPRPHLDHHSQVRPRTYCTSTVINPTRVSNPHKYNADPI